MAHPTISIPEDSKRVCFAILVFRLSRDRQSLLCILDNFFITAQIAIRITKSGKRSSLAGAIPDFSVDSYSLRKAVNSSLEKVLGRVNIGNILESTSLRAAVLFLTSDCHRL